MVKQIAEPAANSVASDPPLNGRTRVLGVAVESLGAILPEFLEHIVWEAARHQFGTVIFPWGSVGNQADISAVAPGLDGLILLSELLAPLASAMHGLPVVILTERVIAGAAFDQVVLESEFAGKRAAEYIASAARTSVAAVAVKEFESQSLRGFLDGVSNYDLILSKEHVIYCKEERHDATVKFKAVWRNFTSLPQAIYCDDGNIACGVIEALHAVGIAVPKDIWVIGHGLAALTHSPFYNITTIAPTPKALASKIVGLVSARIGAPEQPWAVSRFKYDVTPGVTTDFFQIMKPKQ